MPVITIDQIAELERAIEDLVESLEAEYGELAGGYRSTYERARRARALLEDLRAADRTS